MRAGLIGMLAELAVVNVVGLVFVGAMVDARAWAVEQQRQEQPRMAPIQAQPAPQPPAAPYYVAPQYQPAPSYAPPRLSVLDGLSRPPPAPQPSALDDRLRPSPPRAPSFLDRWAEQQERDRERYRVEQRLREQQTRIDELEAARRKQESREMWDRMLAPPSSSRSSRDCGPVFC